MIAVISFFSGDKAQAIRLAEWIKVLGGVKAHDCLLAVHKSANSQGVIEPLREAFGRVGEFTITDDMVADRSRYQYCANIHWKRTAQHIAEMNEPAPWVWLETDAVPLAPEWMDALAAGYKAGGKPFMLDLVNTRSGSTHNSGIGVYPAKVRDYTMRLWQLENDPWDVFFAEDFTPHTFHGPLIHDAVATSPDPTFPDADSLSFIRPGAVLYHRDKTGELIKRLREQRGGVISTRPAAISRESAGESPAPATLRTIYTYNEDIGGNFADPELLAMSIESFRRQGFEMVVLNQTHARTHPLCHKLSTHPALYDKGLSTAYLGACYRRWMAVANMARKTTDALVMVDFDVINYGFTPMDLPMAGDVMTMLNEIAVPGMMIGTLLAFEQIIQAFSDYADDPKPTAKGHVHDQNIVELRSDLWTGVKLMVEYPSEGWKTAKLVHYPHGRLYFPGQRGAKIKELRPLPAIFPEIAVPPSNGTKPPVVSHVRLGTNGGSVIFTDGSVQLLTKAQIVKARGKAPKKERTKLEQAKIDLRMKLLRERKPKRVMA